MKKKLVFILVLALFFSIVMGGKQIKKAYAHYAMLEEEKDYIVVTNNEGTFNTINKKYDEVKSESKETTETLQDNNVMVTEIKLREANDLLKEKNVVAVEENYSVEATGNIDVNDLTDIGQDSDEWNINMINAKSGDNMNVSSKVKVAILDSGVEYSERLNVVSRKSFLPGEVSGNEVFEDISGHGTSVAGVLAARANNGSTLRGVNSNVEIYSAKVLDEENKAPISRVIAGIYWAIDNKVNIISISFGTTNYSKALELAIKEATDKGILVVAAAGNENSDVVEYPAAFENVLAVGGVDSQGNISSESSKGENIDIFAPGEKVRSLGSFDGEVIVSGTSIAVPHVVGVASVLWQKDISKSADFIKNLIVDSANKSNENIKQGIVDLKYALDMYDTYKFEDKLDGASNNVNKSYLAVEDTNNYVTGSWGSIDHQTTVIEASANANLNTAQIKLLKWGAIYSDKSSYLQGMTTNPYFHGYNKKKDYETTKQAYNYLAGYIYLTRCALAGTYNQNKSDLLNTTGNISEMDEKLQLINFGGSEKFAGKVFKQPILLGYRNTEENRGLLLWGMAMHTAADVFAHSSYTEYNNKMTYISHEASEINEADNSSYIPARFNATKAVVKNVLAHYINGTEGSVEDFILDDTYYDGSFQIRNLQKYAAELTTLNSNQDQTLRSITKYVGQ